MGGGIALSQIFRVAELGPALKGPALIKSESFRLGDHSPSQALSVYVDMYSLFTWFNL